MSRQGRETTAFGAELEETIEDLDTRHAFTVRYLDPTTSPMHEAQPYPMPYRRNMRMCGVCRL